MPDWHCWLLSSCSLASIAPLFLWFPLSSPLNFSHYYFNQMPLLLKMFKFPKFSPPCSFFSKLTCSSWAHLSTAIASITKRDPESEQLCQMQQKDSLRMGNTQRVCRRGVMTKFQYENHCFIDMSIVAHSGEVGLVSGPAKEVTVHDISEEAVLT